MNWLSTLKISAAGLAVLLLVSCASGPRDIVPLPAPARVWPATPDEPRISFVQEIRGPRDIGKNPSVWHSMANWITGDTGENLNLHKPFAVALDENGSLALTDMDAKLVCLVDQVHKKWRRYERVGKTRFASPVAVAVHKGIIYVADSELAKIFAFRFDGKPVLEISAPLKRPVGLALAGDSLYVVDALAHAVFKFGLDGKLQSSFGQRGIGPGEFNFPAGLAADNQGHLIVADTLNCRVQKFDLNGNFILQFGSNGDTSGHFARPKGVAADTAGRIYVVDSMFDNFQIFDAAGKLLLNVGETGGGPGGFGLPNGIAIGADNRIFVADAFNHRVQVFKYIGQP